MMDEQTHPYIINSEAIESGRGCVPLVLAPFYLLFRPGRFMLGYGYHASILVVMLVAWVVGSGQMTNWVVNQQRLNAEPLPMRIDSWVMLWGVIIGLGVLRAGAEYGLGGLWVWLRLRICGVRGNRWRASSRIYIFARSIEMVPLLVLLLIFSVRYNDVGVYLEQPVGVGNYIPGAFMFIAPVSAYIMVRSLCRLRSVWAAVLFLVVPMLWRAVVLVGGMLIMMGLSPGHDAFSEGSQRHTESGLAFDYPLGWIVEDGATDDRRADLSNPGSDVRLTVSLHPVEGPDVVELSLDELRGQGYEVELVEEQPVVTLGSQRGYGIEHTIDDGDVRARMFHFVHSAGPGHLTLIRYINSFSSWNPEKPAAMLVVDSVEFSAFSDQEPALDPTAHIERSWFACEIPTNWAITERSHEQYRSFLVSSEHGSRFWCSIFDRVVPAERELETYLSKSLWSDTIQDRAELWRWLRLMGVGAELTSRVPMLGEQRVRAIYVPLEDGRVVGVRFEQLDATREIDAPGFELIERTFQLRGVEPASP